MSANNQIVIVKKDECYNVFHNGCVDNVFNPEKLIPLNFVKPFKTAEDALDFAQDQLNDPDFCVEYGISFMNLDKPKENVYCAELEVLSDKLEDVFVTVRVLKERINDLKTKINK